MILKSALVLTVAFLMSIVGCKKESVSNNNTDALIAEQEIVNVIDETSTKYEDATVVEGTESVEFMAENEGLPESYMLIEQDMDDAGFKRLEEKRFIRCIKNLNLTDSQVLRLRLALRNYENCKAEDIKKHREAYKSLRDRIENIRKEWVAKLRKGDITEAQFKEKMGKLRNEFSEGLKRIKESYAKTLRACYEKFVRAIKLTLTERQWKAFIECYRG